MKHVDSVASGTTLFQALAHGVCPICTLLRAYQNERIEHLSSKSASRLCSYHTWSVAASSPAAAVAQIFLTMLSQDPGRNLVCDLCTDVETHQEMRLRELVQEMHKERFREWFERFGTLCRLHGEAMHPLLDERDAQIIKKILQDNEHELRDALGSFAHKASHGIHQGGGILGRVAEFLVAQRGIGH